MNWKTGQIHDVVVKPLTKFSDDRGWLAEIFRRDELPVSLMPHMGYVSVTDPGLARGPHEHTDQSDLFAFYSGHYRVYLWDSREESPSFGVKQVFDVGQALPSVVIIPPGIVHAYKNEGSEPAFVLNFPNALYAGEGRTQPVDEIRHENDLDSIYSLD